MQVPCPASTLVKNPFTKNDVHSEACNPEWNKEYMRRGQKMALINKTYFNLLLRFYVMRIGGGGCWCEQGGKIDDTQLKIKCNVTAASTFYSGTTEENWPPSSNNSDVPFNSKDFVCFSCQYIKCTTWWSKHHRKKYKTFQNFGKIFCNL